MINQTETNNHSFDSINSSLLLNPSPKLTNLINQFNNNAIIDNNKNTDDNFIHSKIGCGIFVNFQKAFDTVEHEIPL